MTLLKMTWKKNWHEYITEETKATEIDKKVWKSRLLSNKKFPYFLFSNCQSNDFIFTHKQTKKNLHILYNYFNHTSFKMIKERKKNKNISPIFLPFFQQDFLFLLMWAKNKRLKLRLPKIHLFISLLLHPFYKQHIMYFHNIRIILCKCIM